MEWSTPALAFLATTLALGGACLGFLKKRYLNTNHHLMVFVLVGAVAYMAPIGIQRTSQLAVERLAQSWMGITRVFAHAMEHTLGEGEALKLTALEPVVQRFKGRLLQDAGACRSVTLIKPVGDGHFVYQSLGIHKESDKPVIREACDAMVQRALMGEEQWCVDKNKRGEALAVHAIVPLRDKWDVIHNVLLMEFYPEPWNKLRTHEQWRVVGEFTGLLVICLCLGGFLIMRAEARRKQELEEAVKPLIEDIESLDGMVNSIHGVVWERSGRSSTFTYLSQNADGYFGYPMEKWAEEKDFLEHAIHSEDRERVKNCWADALSHLDKYEVEYRLVTANGGTAFVSEQGQAAKVVMDGLVLRGILTDVTELRESEASMQDMHKMMVEASRQAGMAEIATGVLHNVGNVLNSLNVGAKLLAERMKKSRIDKLCQATQMVKDNLPSNPDFFVNDKRGLALPGYLVDLAGYLNDEQHRLNATVSDMIERIEHIRDMIMLQQSHSTVRTLWEPLDLATVMEEALRLEMDVHIAHQQVAIERHFADLPPVYSAKGLLLQILVNLLANACQAMADVPAGKRKLVLRIMPQPGDMVRFVVEDSGCGIHARNLTNIFTQGFTTKMEGHGFGLHHASLLAQDLGGSLKAESDGLGKGARFILEISTTKGPKSGPLPPGTQAPAAPVKKLP